MTNFLFQFVGILIEKPIEGHIVPLMAQCSLTVVEPMTVLTSAELKVIEFENSASLRLRAFKSSTLQFAAKAREFKKKRVRMSKKYVTFLTIPSYLR
jgi:hypothetical protein